MAIVPNRGNPFEPIDPSYCTHTRSTAGTPNGTIVPLFAGEIFFDTTNKVRWRAIGKTNADWVPVEVEVT
jgi:hypothetical protein